jgi:(1->4)-alpha-D-glucan 1-alpha-D-glucosylmutase
MRFQQLTGPVMARGVEDTAFYVYHRFISLNEVGGNPERFGTSLDTFHGQNIERTKYWPYAMITTSTHDTKRSEDVRARLNVLSEIPDEWRQAVFRWSRMNKKNKSSIDGQWVPDRNDEYFLYQTLVGTWPILPMNEGDNQIFRRRITDYMVKAVREAKVHTSWINPNPSYENGLLKFIDAVLSAHPKDPFMKDFLRFREKVAYFGMLNSLSQTLLKIASPGVPDFYQGTEIWDFSLVDPDNRRPVDFGARKKMLGILKEKIEKAGFGLRGFCRELLRNWEDGMIKLYVTFKALNDRRKNSQVFKEGDYVPLMAHGELKEHVCAFARQKEARVVLVIVPRFLAPLIQDIDEGPLGEKAWGNSVLIIPREIEGKEFNNIFTSETINTIERDGKGALALHEVFADFPVAMLERVDIK